MHDSVRAFLKQCCEIILPSGFRIVEIGSMDVNGSPREVLADYSAFQHYWGVDLRPGSGVDQVWDCSQAKLPPLPWEYWKTDLVICTEVLEHVKDWQGMIFTLKTLTCRAGAWLILTTRSPGFPIHDHPEDHWRFKLSEIQTMFSDYEIHRLEHDPEAPGVFLLARREPIALYEIHPEKPSEEAWNPRHMIPSYPVPTE